MVDAPDAALVDGVRRHLAWDVPTDVALHALRAARATWTQASDEWVIERAAYLIRRKA